MNLYGAPPARGKEFMQYRMARTTSTIIGAAIAVSLPLGEYYPDRLINLGKNRYIIRPQLDALPPTRALAVRADLEHVAVRR